MAFEIRFSPVARDHLRAMRKRDQQIVTEAIVVQLEHQPDQSTSNRKQLEDNALAPWELRVGDFHVFYDTNADDRVVVVVVVVVVVAVGQKSHDRLRIGGEEIDL
jgi:mRNA-degrading endonuclease RelE of RelBE toxin-antitoxin system